MLDAGVYASVSDIGDAENICEPDSATRAAGA
jgi:hypothetical protein